MNLDDFDPFARWREPTPNDRATGDPPMGELIDATALFRRSGMPRTNGAR